MQAIKYYQRASQHFPDANYCIGYIYEGVLGVGGGNWATEKSIYRKASSAGHELAEKRLTWSYALVSTGLVSPPDDAALQAKNPSESVIM